MLYIILQEMMEIKKLLEKLLKVIWLFFMVLRNSFMLQSIVVKENVPQESSDDATQQTENKYIDQMLRDVHEDRGMEYDPYGMEDSTFGFSKKVAFVNVSGKAELINGYITGLKTLHRTDDSQVERDGDGKRTQIVVSLAAGEIEFHQEGTVKFMNMGPRIAITASLSYIEMTLKFSISHTETGKTCSLDELYQHEIKGMVIEMSGLGSALNWAINLIMSGLTVFLKGQLHSAVERRMKPILAGVVERCQFPDTINELSTQPSPKEVSLPESGNER